MMTRLPSSPFILPENSQKFIIRTMHSDDIEAVCELDRLSFSAPWPKDSFSSEINNPSSLCRLAEITYLDGTRKIIASMVTWIILDEAHISTLAVHPEHRRRGIAQLMMVDALKICCERGVVTVTLEVRAGNIPAQTLYKKFGFEIIAVQKEYYSDNHEDGYIMTLDHLNPQIFIQDSST